MILLLQAKRRLKKAYKAAADDFHAVINNYGLNLFRNGEPGEWGELGDANVLPNYFYLFLPTTGNVNTDGEIILHLLMEGLELDKGNH